MASEPNYLLGKGENLVGGITLKKGGDAKPLPYSFDQAKQRITPRARQVAHEVDALPDEACPNDEAVAALVIHPDQLAKSYYPANLLSAAGLRAIGSRTTNARLSGDRKARTEAPTTEFFVAAPRATFRQIPSAIDQWSQSVPWADDLCKIQDFHVVLPRQRIKPIHNQAAEILCEVILHGAGSSNASRAVLAAFARYVESLGLSVDIRNRVDAANLSFVALKVPKSRLEDVAKFSFLRAVREMPRLRYFEPGIDNPADFTAFPCPITDHRPVDSSISVAVFDGGVPDVHAFRHCVITEDVDGVGEPVEEFLQHGLAVTSALLFGSLRDSSTAPIPFTPVHHFRVLDKETLSDSQHELYTVLNRIKSVLDKRHFDFISCSLGPYTPTDDDEIHPWTAVLDEHTSDGRTLLVSAVGNTGEASAEFLLNRIQPPSDGVNIVGIGACDTEGDNWHRASYSSLGRGRSPGVMKPDALAFGGDLSNPFWVVDYQDHDLVYPTMGTSIAGPNALRSAIGARVVLGGDINPLVAKAIMLHRCELNGDDVAEIGWGRICTDIEKLITCDNDSVHVIYKGILEPKQWVQAGIPMLQPEEMQGMVTLSATLCFACPVEPSHPMHYTSAGLDIVFRRNKANVKEGKTTAASTTFFRAIEGVTEDDLRADWHKWETVRRASGEFQGRTLKDPVLDIHYNPRRGGQDTTGAPPIPYAMVVSVQAPKIPDFYERIVNKYRIQLEVMRPRIRIPVAV